MSPVRRVGVAVAVAAACLTLVACQAGRNAQTSQDYSPADGRNINAPLDAGPRDPYLAIRGAIIVTNEAGQATLVATVRNRTDAVEGLVSVTANDIAGTFSAGPIPINPNTSVSIGSVDGPAVTWDALGVAPGTWTTLIMRFANAGNVTRDVLVVDQSGIYADVPITLPPPA